MDGTAIALSARLAGVTLLVLLPLAVLLGRWLAVTRTRFKPWIEGLLALPLVLPPTVVGYYLLVAMGNQSALGRLFEAVVGHALAFSFGGLVFASVLVNVPFAVQPVQRAFESISPDLREAAQCCGLTRWQALWRIELPLAWPGLLSAAVLTFAHTLGEFGVVLMVGGNIPGETQTVAISIYDRTQSFDHASAGAMAALLLVISLVTMAVSYGLVERLMRRRRSA
ncbi:Molybdenum transport system permease protein modB [Methyloversatilis universalis FAM5]|uniref:Molybdenum transport system permease n=1 Tax=Methyloversatilis universalis (strain ATCC BAA-1314 / DSM 25237 / JCM 13912 / CCUG 52030 / FAM5) TaxID=1000565 RepID=F5RAC1_METUF|nr:molybdate ABC transporter permease subunit [Methyloversatilis universalis]EGK72517.1 Molybdenum transport system permease protein modB [Methyloversatilis universalis FAM5]